jgi:hypothetical protein
MGFYLTLGVCIADQHIGADLQKGRPLAAAQVKRHWLAQ